MAVAKDENSVKVDESHYFFTLCPTKDFGPDSSHRDKDGASLRKKRLNYGLTIASKGQEHLLEELEKILADYSYFRVQQVSEEAKETRELRWQERHLRWSLRGEEKDCGEAMCCLLDDFSYWFWAFDKGILWCGDVTTDQLGWVNDFMKRRLSKAKKERDNLKIIKRERMTKMTENVANRILCGVIKVYKFSGKHQSRKEIL